ncbi:MAG TPA: carboxypeptidase-like regulatory domain-containing protein [Longimicrobiaceae bacterium]|nr:carboxypeptidase-like regulatory domain-containing protein [Longimicrobiaceae bacterium]
MPSRLFATLWLLAGTLASAGLSASSAAAQQTEPAPRVLSGQVVKDGQPVPDAAVTVHRVTAEKSGPIAHLTSGQDGHFSLPLPPPDTVSFTVYFATVDYESVRYFGAPLHPEDTGSGYQIEVFDTVSALPGAIRTSRRDLVFVRGTDGRWQVNEAVRIHNSADRTLVSAGGMPTWTVPLPEGFANFQTGEGELGANDIKLMGDEMLVLASLVPGDREVFVRYTLPATLHSTELTVGNPTDSLNVYVQQPAPNFEIAGLPETTVLTVEGQKFVRYSGVDLAKGDRISAQWESNAPPVSPVLAGAVVAAVLLLLASWIAFRNRETPVPDAGPGARTTGQPV